MGVDLSNYTGDFGITGNLHVTGNTLMDGNLTVLGDTSLNDLSFQPGTEVNRNNTTQTGTTVYDANYEATYADGSVINQNGETIYGPTSNTTGTQNFDENYVANYT